MDEYAGGISTNYMTNGVLLNRGLELLAMLKEDMPHMGAEDLHHLQRTWELNHRLLASESVTHHTLFRYDRDTGKWAMEKAPVHHIID